MPSREVGLSPTTVTGSETAADFAGTFYADYFATDDLMFTVPKVDTRLKNKAEVLTFHPYQSYRFRKTENSFSLEKPKYNMV